MRRLFLRLRWAIVRNVDLLALWWFSVLVQVAVPAGHILERDDLIPWLMLWLAVAALARGRLVGSGPHPQLARRSDNTAAQLRGIGLGLVPLLIFLLYEGARTGELTLVVGGAALVGLLSWILAAARVDGSTAWNPRGLPSLLLWALLLATVAGGALGVGELTRRFPQDPRLIGVAPALLLGLGFVGITFACGQPRNLRQRLAAGRTDGGRVRPPIFRPARAFLGPAGGLLGLLVIAETLGGASTDFRAAFVGSLHVFAWAGVLWPRPIPVAVHCILHEVVPASGRDEEAQGEARGFDAPPEGALRLNPLRIRRTRSLHPWLVPVQSSRIDELDDPVRPLWPARPMPGAQHALGEAVFALDRASGLAQWERITLRLHGSGDTASVRGGEGQVRRIWVIDAFPRPSASSDGRPGTYAWDVEVPPGALQEVDAATESIELRAGNLLILASGGSARAYELEVGETIDDWRNLSWARPPQYQDYT